MLFIFKTPEVIRNLWQLKTAVFLHAVLFHFKLENAKINFKNWSLKSVKEIKQKLTTFKMDKSG
jgi:hypothetical protein